MKALRMLWLACLLAAAPVALGAVKLDVHPDRESGVYAPGDQVAWTVKAAADSDPVSGTFKWIVKRGGLDAAEQGEGAFKEGAATLVGQRADAGTLLLEVKYRPEGAGRDVVVRGGAVFAPEKIKRSSEVPDDFDAFWAKKIEQLHAIPMNVKLEAIDVGDPTIEYFKITMDNINGRKIYGQIARPKDGKDLPALLQVQWAGVYPLRRDWVTGHAKQGWLSMNIIAHDLPIDEPDDFYKQKSAKELDDYPGIGADDRETSYFLPMFLSCRRAVDYLTQREDWNKKSVVVHGGSQGGYQAIVTAGIHPAVTAFAANVPAGCDHTGKRAGRAPGWPNWTGRTWKKMSFEKLENTGRYFDAMNFAPRAQAQCDVLVGVGLVDVTCPAEGIFATVNELKGKTQTIIMPRSGHGGEGPGHKAYYEVFWRFLNAHK